MEKIAVISLSGGMDSTCLLTKLLAEGHQVYGVSFDYGQKHSIELERLKQNLEYLDKQLLPIRHENVDLRGIGRLLNSSLIQNDQNIPEGHYEEENMKSTVVPNRNAIFSSVIYAYALSIAKERNNPVSISLGVHSGDHAIYPDCTPGFYESIMKSFNIGNWDSELVSLDLPYLHGNKTSILKDCLMSCKKLGINFDTVLRNTNTSYNPDSLGRSSGTSGADIERIEAFINIDRKDPVEYVLPWEQIKENAIKILKR